MMRWCLIVGLLALGACSLQPEMPALPDREALPLGAEVDSAYEKVVAHPREAEANGKLGMVLHRRDNYALAEILYHRAFLLEPGAFRWIYYIAEAQASQDNYDAAVATLRHALRQDPSYVPAKLRLAELTFRMGNLVESEQIYQQLTGNEEAAATANYWLGRIEARQGHPEEAMEFYRRACERFPAYGPAHFALGSAAAQTGEEETAREHFILAEKYKMQVPPISDPLLAAIRGESTRASDYLRRGYELESRGKIKEAAQEYEKALRIDSRAAEAHARLVRIAAELGQPAEAEKHYRKAAALDPDAADAYSNYGAVLLQQKRYQEARTAFERALAVDPYHPEALMHLAYLQEIEHQPQPAERNYREAIQCRPGYREAHLRLGSLLRKLGRYEEAAKQFDAALEKRDEKTPRLLYEIAVEYGYAGNARQARTYLAEARRLAARYGQVKLLDEIDKQSRGRW